MKKNTPEDIILSKDGSIKGKIINFESHPCSMEGCRSYRASVRWEDGTLTYPCMSMVFQVSEHLYQLT